MLFHTFPKFTQSWLIAGYSGLGFSRYGPWCSGSAQG
jgi:hypothetical protein